ncbi:MAG: Lrp/AsnC family transcriptional regulator [Spirochaetales bacterium]|nr:Lrp/AsnC family transcriptional regulator [Spirochaetales bacterium]
MQPDEIDWKIIENIRKEHKNNNAIARELGVSEGMIRQRLKKLKDAGVVKISGLINPDVLENKMSALIAATLSDGSKLDEKARQIAAFDEVLSVSVSTGRYDLMIEILVESNQGLVKFITEKLSLIQGLRDTETFVMLKTYGKFV